MMTYNGISGKNQNGVHRMVNISIINFSSLTMFCTTYSAKKSILRTVVIIYKLTYWLSASGPKATHAQAELMRRLGMHSLEK